MATEAYRRHLDRARSALQEAITSVIAQVPAEVMRRPPVDPRIRTARAEVAEALGRYPAPCVNGFAEALERIVEDSLAPASERNFDLDALGIMDDQQAQEEIEVVQAGRILAEDAGGPLLRLRRLESELDAEFGWRGDSPVGPAGIGRALWRATERLPLSLLARTEAVRCAMRLLGGRIGPLYTALVEDTQQGEGVAVPTDVPAPQPQAPHSAGRPRASDAAPRRRARQPTAAAPSGSALAPSAPAGTAARFDVTRPGALVELMAAHAASPLRDAIPCVAETTGVLDASGLRRVAPSALAGPSADVGWLIHRIFDELVAESTLGADEGASIDRLRPAVLQLAAHDAQLLQTHQHPAWRLVNQLSSLLAGDAAHRPPNLDAWLERLTAKLRADPRRERFESAERKLSAWRDGQARRQATKLEPAVELLRRHALLEQGAEAARKRLERRLDASRADEAVRRFVSTIWALACARQAAAAEPVATSSPDAWDTATDLIWSTSPARSRVDSPTLMAMIPALVDRLRIGMSGLDLDPAVQDAWLARLAALHVRAMQRTPEDAQTDMPLTIDLALEDEFPPVETPAPPALELELRLPGLAPAATDPLAALAIGDRFSMAVRGTWDQVSLVWRSDNGQFLLLARPDGSTLSVSRRSLQRLLNEGLAALPDTDGALARAAQRIAEGEP